MSLEKIPVTIVTGFLGSGKTTLIRHLLQNPGGRRLAVLVNEFGTVGVDGEILKACADENCPETAILELANGCICCAVADDFIPTVEKLLALPHRPDHILIETSGLALPKPLLKAFDWPAIRSRITVDGVIALADAEAVAAGRFAPDVEVRPTECLSACTQGCSVALTRKGSWTYVYGRLSEADVPDILAGAAAYAASPDGIVPWRQRPVIFRKQSLARIPPLEL